MIMKDLIILLIPIICQLLLLSNSASATISSDRKIKITPAGRHAILGDLYDASKNELTGENLFSRTLPSSGATSTNDITQANTNFEVVDSLSEKIHLLGIEPLFAIENAAGIIHSPGIISSLRDHVWNGKRREGWLIHRVRTVEESLKNVMSTSILRNLISSQVLYQTKSTHFLAEIHYGADVLFTFSTAEFDSRPKSAIKADLEKEINNSGNNSTRTAHNYLINTFADIQVNHPQKIQEALTTLNDIQKILQDNNNNYFNNSGKGRPVQYVLIPLTILQSEMQFKYVNFQTCNNSNNNDSLYLQLLPLLDDISSAFQNLNDLKLTFDENQNIIATPDQTELQSLRTLFESSFHNWKHNLSDKFEKFRCGQDIASIPDLAQSLRRNLFVATKFDSKISNLTSNSRKKIDIHKQILAAGHEYLGKSGSLEVLRWQTMNRTLYVLYYNLKLISNDELAWQKNTQLISGPLNRFSSRIAVLDCDFNVKECEGLNKTTIREFRRGVLTRGVVTHENIAIQGNSQCIMETLALEQVQMKLRESEATSKALVQELNATIARLQQSQRESRLGHVFHSGRFQSANPPKKQNITTEYLAELLGQPKARLYTKENLSGKYEDYSSFSPTNKGRCFNLLTYNQQIKSVDSLGTCVRLFQLMDCAGWSVAIYPGSPHSLQLDDKLDGVFSIGQCIANEFDNSLTYTHFQDDFPLSKSVQKVIPLNNNSEYYTPDWIQFGGMDDYVGSYHLWDKENPITNFKQGIYTDRIEYIRAFIYTVHLRNQLQVDDLEMSSYTRNEYDLLDKKAQDIPGYAIPLKYGGPADELYNIFPQGVESEALWIAELDEALVENMNEGMYGLATIHINFMYANSNITRPFAFAYHISNSGSGDKVRYGVIEN